MAEAHGRIDFGAELEVSESNGAIPVGSESNWVDVTARVQTGSPYVVGRINFSGHYRVNESTLRRAMILQERALFDVGQLRRSLARLNGSGLFEPITPDDVEIQRNPAAPDGRPHDIAARAASRALVAVRSCCRDGLRRITAGRDLVASPALGAGRL